MKKKLIIVGLSSFAEIAFKYFQELSEYEVVSFCVEKKFLGIREKYSLPVYAFEEIEEFCDPSSHFIFVAITYTKLNRERKRILDESIQKGYRPASFISKYAYLSKDAIIGEHCFIFEDNTIQPFVEIKDNVILWSGNHIGHHSIIMHDNFISSHVVISGHCKIGSSSFIGVNSTISNNVEIGKDNWIGPGSLISKNTKDNSLFKTPDTIKSKVDTHKFFRI